MTLARAMDSFRVGLVASKTMSVLEVCYVRICCLISKEGRELEAKRITDGHDHTEGVKAP